MRVAFTFDRPDEHRQFPPSAMARMLVDIDGLVFLAVAMTSEHLREVLAREPFEQYEYEQFVYLGGHFGDDDPKSELSNYHSKINLDRLNYNSPPRISISLRASLDVNRSVDSVIEFLKYILTIGYRWRGEELQLHEQRQEVLGREIRNMKEIASLLDGIEDPELRDRFQQALLNRIDPLTSGRDYPALTRIIKRGP